jgi:hypothetical protein
MISRLPPEQPSDDGAEELLGIAAAFIECRRQFVRPARRARALQIRLPALETSREPDHGTTTCKRQEVLPQRGSELISLLGMRTSVLAEQDARSATWALAGELVRGE